MNPRGFSIQFIGVDGFQYVILMSETAALTNVQGGNGHDPATAVLNWSAGVWTMDLADDTGGADTWTAPAPVSGIVPTNVGDWTPTTANGTVLVAINVNVP